MYVSNDFWLHANAVSLVGMTVAAIVLCVYWAIED